MNAPTTAKIEKAVATAMADTERAESEAILPRLAFSLRETAEMLGLAYITVYRLVQRGKLKSCGDLRTKLIAKTEIDRFLRA